MQRHATSLCPKNFPRNLIVFFTEGLIGFHHLKEMMMIPFAKIKDKDLYMLKSLNNPDHAWVLISSLDILILKNNDSVIENKADDPDDDVFYILKPCDDKAGSFLEATLMAPLWINRRTGKGSQRQSLTVQGGPLIVGSIQDISL